MRKCRPGLSFFLATALPGVFILGGRGAEEPQPAPEKLEVGGLHNVFRLNSHLYSGNGPEGDRSFESLKKLGIKTVISVDGAKPDLERAKKFGIRYVHLPIGYNGVPAEKALQIAKVVIELPGPIYIHCHHGQHRGPSAAAIALLCSDEKCRVEDALAVLRSAGTDPRYTALFKSVKEFQRPTAEQLRNLPAELPESAKVVGMAQAMVTIDHSWDNLKKVRAAKWTAPPEHPDIDPVHEALQLVEGYRELQRLPEIARRPDEFRKFLNEGHEAAVELEQVLRGVNDKKEFDKEAAEKIFRRAGASCTQCHAKYRDVQ